MTTPIGVDITDGSNEVMLFSNCGKVVRFHEENVRSMGRTAAGVRGIRLLQDGHVVSLIIPRTEQPILTLTENGLVSERISLNIQTVTAVVKGLSLSK